MATTLKQLRDAATAIGARLTSSQIPLKLNGKPVVVQLELCGENGKFWVVIGTIHMGTAKASGVLKRLIEEVKKQEFISFDSVAELPWVSVDDEIPKPMVVDGVETDISKDVLATDTHSICVQHYNSTYDVWCGRDKNKVIPYPTMWCEI